MDEISFASLNSARTKYVQPINFQKFKFNCVIGQKYTMVYTFNIPKLIHFWA